jgi:hypothetical protein
MGKWLDKFAGSISFWALIVAIVYFSYSLYFAVTGLQFSYYLSHDRYIYNLVSRDPWWWQVLYYGSEGVTGSIAIVLRAFAGLFAVYAAALYWRKKDTAMASIRRNVSRALAFEAGFFLFLIPSIIAGLAYNSTSLYLFYFDHTPGLLLIYGTVIPCLAIVLTVPPLLLKLRGAVKKADGTQEIHKWSCLTGVAYLLVVFWFNYCLLWAGMTVPYPRAYQEFGLSFITVPVNFVSFALTVFGLFALGLTLLAATFPAIKKQPSPLNLTRVGAVMVAFSGYFIFTVAYFYLTGGYSAHPSVWYEVISPGHNANLWAVALILIGVPMMLYSKRQGKTTKKNVVKQE